MALVCLPRDGGLVAIGGRSKGKYLDNVEGLLEDNAHNWRTLAPLPIPLAMRSAVLFRQRILVSGGQTTGNTFISDMFAFHPPTSGDRGQWSRLKPMLSKPAFPSSVVTWGKEVFLVGMIIRVSYLASVWMLKKRFFYP